MKLSYFKFNLPKELIADKPTGLIPERPSDNRDVARMMVLHRDTGEIEHRQFKDLIDYVDTHDVVVANNTKVFPSRLYGEKEKTGAKITVFLLRELNEEMLLWDVVVDPARKIRIGNKLFFGEDLSIEAEVIDNTTSRGRTIRFLYEGDHDEFISLIKSMGSAPIPDEILNMRETKPWDMERYQTIFAKHEGAVMAPTTGMHISRELLKRFEIKDVDWTELTIHIGQEQVIEVEDLSKHRMGAEEMHINEETCDLINNAHQKGHKVCSIGASTLRALESAVTIPGKVSPYDGWTNKFIFPPYEFTIADMLATNFHHPQSSQFIMVSAFAGAEFMKEAYQVAIREKYHFGCYGDSMLIV